MNPSQKPTKWLRDWLDERCRLADGCIDLRADEVRVWFMFRELLLPEMDRQDAMAEAYAPPWLEAYMARLIETSLDPKASADVRTFAGTAYHSLSHAYLTALCRHYTSPQMQPH